MKKGMAATMIAALILALVFTGVAVNIVKKVSEGTCNVYDTGSCKTSVLLNAKDRVAVANIQKNPLDCPTKYVTFHKDKVVFESRNCESNEEIKCGNLKSDSEKQCYLNSANKVIAKLMFACWDQFAAGRIEVLSAWKENQRQCVLCSRFEFSEDVQEAFRPDVGALEVRFSKFGQNEDLKKDFTLDNYMRSRNDPMHKISYYEFTMDPIDTFKMPFYDYSFSEPWAIVFSAINEEQSKVYAEGAWKWLKEHKLTIPYVGNVNPVYDGSNQPQQPEFVNIMELVRYKEVSQECDTLE